MQGDADTIVAYFYLCRGCICFAPKPNLHFFAGVLHGIVYQVGKYFAQAEDIGKDCTTFGTIHTETDRLHGFQAELLCEVVQKRAQKYFFRAKFQFATVYLCQQYYAVGERQQMLAFVLHRLAVFFLFLRFVRQLAAFQYMRSHHDGLQGRFHVMHHGIGEVLLELLQAVLLTEQPYLEEYAENNEQKRDS